MFHNGQQNYKRSIDNSAKIAEIYSKGSQSPVRRNKHKNDLSISSVNTSITKERQSIEINNIKLPKLN